MASQLNLLRKHNQGTMTTDELVFVYPMLISSSLDRFSGDLRQFMMVQFLAQIKMSNAFNVTSSIVKTKSSSNGTNPAESLYQNLGVGGRIPQDRTGDFQVNDQFAQQQQIDKFKDMLVHLVATEPRFSELDPIVTTLTMDNLLTIPIIAASKKFKLAEDVLYWILFAAAGQNIKLNTESNIPRIEAVLRHIPKQNYLELLDPALVERAMHDQHVEDRQHVNLMAGASIGGDVYVPLADGNHKHFKKIRDKYDAAKEALREKPDTADAAHSLRYFNSVRDKLGKTLGLFRVVLNSQEWTDESGIESTFDTTLSASSISTLGASQTVVSSSNGLFASLISNYVMHLIQSIMHALVSDTEIDVPRLVGEASKEIIDGSRRVTNMLMMAMMAHIQTQTVNSADALFAQLEKQCKANASINIEDILNQLQVVQFSISGNKQELSQFAELLTNAAAKAAPLSDMLAGFISDASAGETIGTKVAIDDVLNIYGREIESTLTAALSDKSIKDGLSARFGILTGDRRAKKFIESMVTSLAIIIKFLTLYTFYSYFCEYVGELNSEVQIKRQDVTSFPNYCLVVPVEIMSVIFGALSAKNFANMLEDPQSFDDNFGEITTQSLTKVIQVLGDRLGVTNIMVVDDKAKTVYYKWSFSRQVQRIAIGTLKSYVHSQKEYIKAN